MPHKNISIGTSGWSYPHWKKNFYPENLKTQEWLHFYSEHFPTIEVNTTFYHLPLLTSVENWYKQVPKNFLFSIKASRYITHQKRLNDCENSLKLFFKHLKPLKEKLGPILFQLAPSFKQNIDRLTHFIQFLDDDHQYVFEFRHPSWFVDEVYEILAGKNIALCITDLNKIQSPEVMTANFTYIRLHGPKKAYQGTYGPKQLRLWKNKIEIWEKQVAVFCYFDNDEKGYAIEDAMFLQKLF